ncbi:MAG: Rpn family recombination-promoting nuclease/putative transposase [Cellulomonas sp.]|jgi:predicted transposase/invertase (TIGR01784 family)|nr:Rpn family recombination-promoting nuclease/putative transposase [Cellulomonas sp.]
MKTYFNPSSFPEDIRRRARQYAASGKPLNLLQDIVFKDVFSADNEDSREALRFLLSSIIHREVSRLRIMNTELLPEYRDGKTVCLDIHVTFNDGEAADLEMQMNLTGDNLKNRAAYYAARLLSGQGEKGGLYGRIKRVYQVFFLNAVLFPGSTKLPRRYYLMEEKEQDKLTDAVEVIFYELPKLEGLVKGCLEGREPWEGLESLSVEEKWCIYFKYKQDGRAARLIEELCREEEGIMRAEQALTKVSRDYEKWARALSREKAEMDYYAGITYAREEGLSEGLSKGQALGRAEGLSEGYERAIQEARREKLETARKLKEIGLSAEKIEAATGLDVKIHVDGASGAMVAPFAQPDLAWDFRVDRVVSVNTSGHKYGLVYPGVGWVLWRDQASLPDDLVFHVDYLGGDMPTFALNFSRPGAQVLLQYYIFLRLGFDGFRRVQQTSLDVAAHLARGVAAMGPFELWNDGSDIPVFAWSLRPEPARPWDLDDLSDRLRTRGWLVPAYPMPADLTDLTVQRIVVRNGLSLDLAGAFLADLRDQVDHLDQTGAGHRPRPGAGFRH